MLVERLSSSIYPFQESAAGGAGASGGGRWKTEWARMLIGCWLIG